LTRYAYYLPLYATAIGCTVAATGTLNFFVMMGNVCGKLVIGAVSDKLGVWKDSRIQFLIVGISFIILILSAGTTAVRLSGGLLFGASFSLAAVLPAMLSRAINGDKDYQVKLSKLTIWMNLCAAGATLLIGFVVDHLGGYSSAFLAGSVICAVSIILLFSLKRIVTSPAKQTITESVINSKIH
jgi:predicted MFS family arabinose efflux permease